MAEDEREAQHCPSLQREKLLQGSTEKKKRREKRRKKRRERREQEEEKREEKREERQREEKTRRAMDDADLVQCSSLGPQRLSVFDAPRGPLHRLGDGTQMEFEASAYVERVGEQFSADVLQRYDKRSEGTLCVGNTADGSIELHRIKHKKQQGEEELQNQQGEQQQHHQQQEAEEQHHQTVSLQQLCASNAPRLTLLNFGSFS